MKTIDLQHRIQVMIENKKIEYLSPSTLNLIKDCVKQFYDSLNSDLNFTGKNIYLVDYQNMKNRYDDEAKKKNYKKIILVSQKIF